MKGPASILRAPALHFAVAGALLFVAVRAFEARPSADSHVDEAGRTIVVDATRIRGLQRDFSLANKAQVSEAETRALVDKAVTEEILFREALARGLEQGDRAIAWRLVQKMRFLGEDGGEEAGVLYHRALDLGLHLSDPVVRQVLVEKVRLAIGWSAPRPTDAELGAWYDEHAGEFGQAGRVTLRHVYFDRGRRGADGSRQAAEEARRKAVGQGAEVSAALGGDPFVTGRRLVAQSGADLDKLFGPAFSSAVMAMPTSSWEGPVESAYGWHVVFLEQRLDPRIPALDEVRSRVEKTYENERRAERVAEFLARVRPLYRVEIDEGAMRGGWRG